MYTCVSVHGYVHNSAVPVEEDGTRSLETGVTSDCDTHNVWDGN